MYFWLPRTNVFASHKASKSKWLLHYTGCHRQQSIEQPETCLGLGNQPCVSLCTLFPVNVVSVTVSSVGWSVLHCPNLHFGLPFQQIVHRIMVAQFHALRHNFPRLMKNQHLFVVSITLTGRDAGRVPKSVSSSSKYLHVFLFFMLPFHCRQNGSLYAWMKVENDIHYGKSTIIQSTCSENMTTITQRKKFLSHEIHFRWFSKRVRDGLWWHYNRLSFNLGQLLKL